jgi:hypothetical protein
MVKAAQSIHYVDRTMPLGLNWLDPTPIYRAITWIVLALFPRVLAEAMMTIFGLWTAILPLLLWVAWSPELLIYVLISGAVSFLSYALFAIALAPACRTTISDEEWQRNQDDLNIRSKAKPKKTWRDIA